MARYLRNVVTGAVTAVAEDDDATWEGLLNTMQGQGNPTPGFPLYTITSGNDPLAAGQIPDHPGTTQIPPLVAAGVLAGQGNGPYWLQALGTVLYALVTNDRVVKAYDISNPALPVLIATSAALGTSPAYIQARGSYVYVTDSADLTLRVLNATTLADAGGGAVSYASTAGGAAGGGRFDVDDSLHYAVIGGPESGTAANKASVMDVSNAAAPVLSGALAAATGSTHRGVAHLGSHKWALCSRDDATVLIVDTSTPSAPTVSKTLSAHGTVTTPCLKVGKTLYVGNYGSGGIFETWDVTDPANPAFLDSCSYASGGGSEQIAVLNGVAYIACRATNQLAAVDVSAPGNISLLGDLPAQEGGTVTPGVACDPTGLYVYQTSAGNTRNGLIMVAGTPATVSELATDLEESDASVVVNANLGNVFGDGSDGAVVLDGVATVPWASLAGSTYTMTRACHCTSLVVNSGVTVKTVGCAIFVQGAMSNAGTISYDGNAASGATPGAAFTSVGTLGTTVDGGAGNTGAGGAGLNASGGLGGNGGTAGAGGTGAAGAKGFSSGGVAGTTCLRQPSVATTGTFGFLGTNRVLSGGASGGGGGGDGTNHGGGGGAGGGVVVIFAHTFSNTGTVSAQGGAGGNGFAGNAGGGGGGGGGVIAIYTLTSMTGAGTLNVSGGAAGTHVGSAPAADGSAGATGNSLNIILH